jgi:hypothetical protein
MTKKDSIKLFEEKTIRTVWNEDREEWYFSVVDVVAVLTDSDNPQVYWRVLKKRLLAEGNQTVTNCNGLKMLAPDGKMRMTDVADTFNEHIDIARRGGNIAKEARLKLEAETGKAVVTPLNANAILQIKESNK